MTKGINLVVEVFKMALLAAFNDSYVGGSLHYTLRMREETEMETEVGVKKNGGYFVCYLYNFCVMIPETLNITMWVGFYLLNFQGNGEYSITYNNEHWKPGDWSMGFWWLAVYPFICVPRTANGEFYLYYKNSYYKVVADDTAQLVGYEVEADWNTRTGRTIKDNTWKSRQ